MSDRSSHFVHRLQTLPSALAGVPVSRRLLALAAVLALLVLALLPTAGQAQTPYDYSDDARAPRNLLAQAEAGGVALRWLPPAEDAASVDGYEILRRRPDQGEPTPTTLVSDTGNADTTYFDATATEAGVRYNYRVKAIRNGVRSSDWSNYSTVVRPPSAPPPPPPLVSNTGQSPSNQAGIFHQYAQGFRLGKHGQGYEISSVSIDLAAVPSRLTVSLWIDAPPGYVNGVVAQNKLFDFENPPSFRVGLNKFTAPAGAFAYPNVNYAIVLSGFGSSLSIKETTSDGEDAGGETGATIHDSSRIRALGSTGRWGSSTYRGNPLRMAVEGSKRDSGILASTYGQPRGGQEIISVGDHGGIEITLREADRYIIHGLSLEGDDTTAIRKPFTNPFVLREGPWSSPGPKGFSLTMTRAGPGINVWTAPEGATVAGGCPTVTVTETVEDEDGNETEVEREVVRCKSYIFDYDITEGRLGYDDVTNDGILFRWFEAASGSEDTPTAPGVSLGDALLGNIALDTPLMAVLGEPLYAMVSNLGQTDSGYVALGASDSKVAAQDFTTGPVPYRLRGIGINIEGSDDANGNAQVPGGPSRVSVAVHIVSAGKTGPKVFDLVSPGEFIPGHSFFEAPPGTLLLPNTTYAVVWSYLGGTWHRLQRTSSTDEDSGAQPGFRIADSLQVDADVSSLSLHPSGDALEMAVYGEAASAPMVSNLGQDDNGYVSLGGTNSKVLSQSFSIGRDSDRYRLQGIGINIEGSDGSDGNAQVPDGPSSVSVAVHLSGSDTPNVKLFDLVSPDKFEPGHSFFEAPPGALLERDRNYALVWSHVSGTSHRLQRTLSDNEDSGALFRLEIRNIFKVGADIGSLNLDRRQQRVGNCSVRRGRRCPAFPGRQLPGEPEMVPLAGRHVGGGPVQAGLRLNLYGRHVRRHRVLQRPRPGGSSI